MVSFFFGKKVFILMMNDIHKTNYPQLSYQQQIFLKKCVHNIQIKLQGILFSSSAFQDAPCKVKE